jgi:hypothetical protein
MFMMCFLIDVFICVLMGYLQCWVVIIGTPSFQTNFHNEIQLISHLMTIGLKTKPMVLTWVKSIPFK